MVQFCKICYLCVKFGTFICDCVVGICIHTVIYNEQAINALTYHENHLNLDRIFQANLNTSLNESMHSPSKEEKEEMKRTQMNLRKLVRSIK